MAAFWEYARESPRLRRFSVCFQNKKLSDKQQAAARARYAPALNPDEMLLLGSRHFPTLSFAQVRLLFPAVPTFFASHDRFGLSGLVCGPVAIFADYGPIITKALATDESWYLVSIPWDQTDGELAKMFRSWLKTLRPESQREPRRSGRRGRAATSPVDLLHQLSAYRINRLGRNYDEARRLALPHIYVSKKGWNKAIESAKARIDTIGRVPFFTRPC